MGIFNATLEAMKAAGVVLVPFNASSLVEYNEKYIGDTTFYTVELGRELSRRCSRARHSNVLTFCKASIPDS